MTARIYQRPKNAMQSGKALTDQWVLEFAPAEAKKPDPLMGWAGSGDTQQQVRLSFPDEQAALARRNEFAKRCDAVLQRHLGCRAGRRPR